MGELRNIGVVEVAFSYRRAAGGRSVHGGLTLHFDSTRPYSFDSQAR